MVRRSLKDPVEGGPPSELGPRVVVLGCGSIGQRHIRNLRALGIATVGVDPQPAARSVIESLGVTTYADRAEAQTADLAFVCTPSSDHVEQALWAAERRMDLFIEKPLASGLADARELLSISTDRVVVVGYNLRHLPALRALRDRLRAGSIGRPLWARVEFGQYLPDWRPQRDYRGTVSARAALGGGILREASHELDLIRWLFGDWISVAAVARRRSSLDIDVEDTVAAIVEAPDGLVVELHLDMVRSGYRRCVTTVGDKGTLEWCFDSGSRLLLHGGAVEVVAGPDQPDVMYQAELLDLLRCVRDRGRPAAGLDDGIAALELMEAIERSSRAGVTIRR